jgi:hypothetical protein
MAADPGTRTEAIPLGTVGTRADILCMLQHPWVPRLAYQYVEVRFHLSVGPRLMTD